MLARFPIRKMVVIPLFGGQQPTSEQIAAGNKAAADLQRLDARLCPYVTVHPPHGMVALDELRRGIEEFGCYGMKVWVSPANAPDMFPLVEQMIAYGKPILIHAMHKSVGQYPLESDPADVAELGRRYPEARIIMAHIGGNFIYGCEAIREVRNVQTDCSGTFCEQGMIEHAVEQLGADRVLFGSDAPGADFVNNLAKVMAAKLDDDARDQILFRNADQLLS